MAEYDRIIHGELDLQREAANASQLRRHFKAGDVVYVPEVHWPLTCEQVMVSERIYGVPVSDITTLEQKQVDIKLLAERGVEIFFTQVFRDSFFHADMHPGNIFVDCTSPEDPRYMAVDCAIVGQLDEQDLYYLARNLLAIFQQNYRLCAKLHIECGWVPPETPIAEFESALRTLCEPVFERPLSDISFGHMLVTLFRTAGQFDMQVQPQLVLLQRRCSILRVWVGSSTRNSIYGIPPNPSLSNGSRIDTHCKRSASGYKKMRLRCSKPCHCYPT